MSAALSVHEPAAQFLARRQQPGLAGATPQHSAEQLARMGTAGLKAFARMAEAWGLSTDEQQVLLGRPARSTFFAWRRAPEDARLSRDTLERLSNLLGIYKSLQILLPDAAAADAWVRQPNAAPLFAGASALQLMLGGNVSDLNAVRRYLDGVRGGGWS